MVWLRGGAGPAAGAQESGDGRTKGHSPPICLLLRTTQARIFLRVLPKPMFVVSTCTILYWIGWILKDKDNQWSNETQAVRGELCTLLSPRPFFVAWLRL